SELTEQLEASNRSLTETTAALSERELRISEGERRVAGLERRIDALETAAVEPNLPFKLLNFVGSREWTRRGDAARRELSAPRPASGGTVRACYRRAQEPK
ncbi:MAG: hypothetical protein GY856_17415, partial [bacterium]|nr:hypothetical protein [bacterium]